MDKLALAKGKRLGSRYTYSASITEVPGTVATHLPMPDEMSVATEDSVYVTREIDPRTGQLSQNGKMALVRFIRSERVDARLTYQTRVIYQVSQDGDGKYGIERRITNGEAGPHVAARRKALLGRAAVDLHGAATELLAHITNVRDNARTWQPVERDAGLNDVTETEAQEVIDYTNGLL